MEGFRVAVVELEGDAPAVFAEELAEDEIRRCEDGGVAAEILVQVDAAAIFPFPEGLVFPEEDARISLAEAVDALLDVAYEEAVLPVGNEGGDDLLKVIGILVFVHHDFPVFFRRARAVSDGMSRSGALPSARRRRRRGAPYR